MLSAAWAARGTEAGHRRAGRGLDDGDAGRGRVRSGADQQLRRDLDDERVEAAAAGVRGEDEILSGHVQVAFGSLRVVVTAAGRVQVGHVLAVTMSTSFELSRRKHRISLARGPIVLVAPLPQAYCWARGTPGWALVCEVWSRIQVPAPSSDRRGGPAASSRSNCQTRRGGPGSCSSRPPRSCIRTRCRSVRPRRSGRGSSARFRSPDRGCGCRGRPPDPRRPSSGETARSCRSGTRRGSACPGRRRSERRSAR